MTQKEIISEGHKLTQDIEQPEETIEDFFKKAQEEGAELIFINPHDEPIGKEERIRSIKMTAIGKKGNKIVFHDHKKVVDSTSEKNPDEQTNERIKMTKDTFAKTEKGLPGKIIRAPGISIKETLRKIA